VFVLNRFRARDQLSSEVAERASFEFGLRRDGETVPSFQSSPAMTPQRRSTFGRGDVNQPMAF
jgi:hypothetical protein